MACNGWKKAMDMGSVEGFFLERSARRSGWTRKLLDSGGEKRVEGEAKEL